MSAVLDASVTGDRPAPIHAARTMAIRVYQGDIVDIMIERVSGIFFDDEEVVAMVAELAEFLDTTPQAAARLLYRPYRAVLERMDEVRT